MIKPPRLKNISAKFMMENDKFKIDRHKLIYHVSRVYQWLQGDNIYPIYVEVGLNNNCNHRCVFCAFDFLRYKPDSSDKPRLENFIVCAAKGGVKAILYSGEGEPLLRKDAAEIISFTRKAGIDVALSTNGVMLGKVNSEGLLPHLSWIRVSLDAGKKGTYTVVHGTAADDFERVLGNLKQAVKIRNKNKYSCAIGVQFLAIPQNYKEIELIAGILSGIGVDYLVVKPYCRHPLSVNRIDSKLLYKDLILLEEKVKKCSHKNFQVIFRRQAIKKMENDKIYKRCFGLSFSAHITGCGEVYPCNGFVGRNEFCLGNINNENFHSIWQGSRRREIMEKIYNEWNINQCRKSCRLDEINVYLWELRNPPEHVNFI